ncbi:MAG TPA: hypothetical protein VFY45_21335 [Baekduia sp.]|nr:hypothetical protein [Baekduia sp.]
MVSAFVVTSALCGAAWSAASLIAFRFLQGLAGGMIMPIGMITLAQAAGPQRVGRVMGVIGVPMAAGPSSARCSAACSSRGRCAADRGFTAAAITVFLVGGAPRLAAALPLYFPDRARSSRRCRPGCSWRPKDWAPRWALDRAGRLTDRIGVAPSPFAGLFALMLGTVGFTQVTPYWVLEVSLFARGIGLGFMMPAMAAAYSTLERWQVPRATPMLNVMRPVGGSLGTAVLAVVLQHELADAGGRGAGPVARAFSHTYWWALAITTVALLSALVLARAQRSRATGAPAPVPTVG